MADYHTAHAERVDAPLQDVVAFGEAAWTARQHASESWSGSFHKALERGCFDLAFCALMANPNRLNREKQTRIFVERLVRSKSVQKLSTLNLPVAEIYRYLKNALNSQAEQALVEPNQHLFWQIYAFYVQQNDYTSASYILHLYAQRLSISPNLRNLLQEQEKALSVAVTTLSLIPSDSCFLPPRKHSIIKHSKSHFEFFPSKHLDFSSSPSLPIFPSNKALIRDTDDQHVEWCTLKDLENDYFFVFSRNRLLSHHEINNQTPINYHLDEIIEKLAKVNEFGVSLSLAYCFYEGTELDKRLAVVFKIMTKKFCTIQMELLNPTSKKSKTPETIYTSNSSFKENIDLQSYLEKHVRTYPLLPEIVARSILSYDSRFQLPLWLIHLFHGKIENQKIFDENLSTLLSIYIDFDLLIEALELAINILRSSSIHHVSTRSSANNLLNSLWTPLAVIINLQNRVQTVVQSLKNEKAEDSTETEEVHTEAMESLLTELDSAIKDHLAKVKVESEQFAEYISNETKKFQSQE